MWQIILMPLITAALVFLAILMARIIKSDPHEYKLNQRRFGKWSDAIFGKAKIATSSPVADGRVHAGLVFNKDTQKLELQGALSREAVNRIVGS